jgi:hypothetical protein
VLEVGGLDTAMGMITGVRSGWIGDHSKKLLYRHTVEMEQMMACLLAEMKTNQARTAASLKEMKEEMRAGQELLKEEMLTKMETDEERTDAKLDAHHERMMAGMNSELEKVEDAVGVFEERLNRMDTMDLEAN